MSDDGDDDLQAAFGGACPVLGEIASGDHGFLDCAPDVLSEADHPTRDEEVREAPEFDADGEGRPNR